MILLMPFLRLAFEILLLVVLINAGVRELSEWAIAFIIARLIVSFITRINQIPDFFDDPDASIAALCVLKIALEIGIFFAIREDITISTDIILLILLLMILRNISDTWSLIAIGSEE